MSLFGMNLWVRPERDNGEPSKYFVDKMEKKALTEVASDVGIQIGWQEGRDDNLLTFVAPNGSEITVIDWTISLHIRNNCKIYKYREALQESIISVAMDISNALSDVIPWEEPTSYPYRRDDIYTMTYVANNKEDFAYFQRLQKCMESFWKARNADKQQQSYGNTKWL